MVSAFLHHGSLPRNLLGFPNNFPVPIYTPGYREALWEWSVLPKNTTPCPRERTRTNATAPPYMTSTLSIHITLRRSRPNDAIEWNNTRWMSSLSIINQKEVCSSQWWFLVTFVRIKLERYLPQIAIMQMSQSDWLIDLHYGPLVEILLEH